MLYLVANWIIIKIFVGHSDMGTGGSIVVKKLISICLLACAIFFMTVHSPAYANRTTDLQFLHESLQEFKDTPSFQKYGFGVGGPYHWWLETLDEYRADDDHASFSEKLAAGDLRTIGLEYVFHYGHETEITQALKSMIEESLYAD